MHTFPPPSKSPGSGHVPPDASFILETGQCATEVFVFPRSIASCFVIHTQCAAIVFFPSSPRECACSIGRFFSFSKIPKTSFLVSERCMCKCALYFFASAAEAERSSLEQVYGACGAKEHRILPSS